MTGTSQDRVFAGLRIVDFDPDVDDSSLGDLDPDPSRVAWRLSAWTCGCRLNGYRCRHTGMFASNLTDLMDRVGGDSIHGLVVGPWGEMNGEVPPIGLLVSLAPQLPNLRALFIGDIGSDESELSWITQDDVTPLLDAYPQLTALRVRGSDGLALKAVRHGHLRELTFECVELPAAVLRAVSRSDLPALRRLELWLGPDVFGNELTAEDVSVLLDGTRLPALRELGLRDAGPADEIAALLASAPVVAQLTCLDLSMGTLSDEGAEALLAGQPLTHLRHLKLAYHYISAAMAARLRAELPGVDIDLSDPQEAEEDDGEFYRYVQVDE